MTSSTINNKLYELQQKTLNFTSPLGRVKFTVFCYNEGNLLLIVREGMRLLVNHEMCTKSFTFIELKCKTK